MFKNHQIRRTSTRVNKALAVAAVSSGLMVATTAPASAATYGSCISGTGSFSSVDNSGFDRSFTMRHTLSKSCGVHAKTQYKMNFGPVVNTSWKDGLERYTNGSEAGYVRDNFYYSNAARGAYFRVCGASGCGAQEYIDNPYN